MVDDDDVQILSVHSGLPTADPGVARALNLLERHGLFRQESEPFSVFRVGSRQDHLVVVRLGPLPVRPGSLRAWFGLTPREEQVAALLMRRLSNKEIAVRLGIRPRTSWRHTEKVLAKTGAGSRHNVEYVVNRRRLLTGDGPEPLGAGPWRRSST